MVPNSQRINRGGMVLNELIETCRSHDFTDVVILHEHRGEPGGWVGVVKGGYTAQAQAVYMGRIGRAGFGTAQPATYSFTYVLALHLYSGEHGQEKGLVISGGVGLTQLAAQQISLVYCTRFTA